MVLRVHKFMLDVLSQRRSQEDEATRGDRGPEMADDFLQCMELLDTEPFDTELRDFGIEPFDTEALCTNNLDDEFDLGAAP